MSEYGESLKMSSVESSNSGRNSAGCSCTAAGMSKEALLQQIDQVSFAVYDTMLYLDTHQEDENAMEYYRKMEQKRRESLAEYGRLYGPLTADCISATADGCWQWAHQPWPWEGGKC